MSAIYSEFKETKSSFPIHCGKYLEEDFEYCPYCGTKNQVFNENAPYNEALGL